ncbi:carbohydrate ABC transporter permease [Jeotgalibacillus proteolyticus]|uniref:Maltose/maltodextrin transport system permease protein n=1 Tax=Jeotgalibacillus proteolyticus TaxID=2082395 RepID=A0A2S5GH36_9BACL|nr:sugar ABC transporter permease [Jeotgalibacillus proteolyticus]PPA72357.1 sugar ABC transporter permease [Jeotgalibacillus proteolyticus]
MSANNPTARKNHNPKIAMVLSILLAGLGQLYNRRYVKGIIFIILEVSFIVTLAEFINYGIWGIMTLGTLQGTDHSIFLLIYGLISIILIAFALTLYIANVRDAKKDAIRIRNGEKTPTFKEGVRNVWDTGFPYFFITPGLIMLAFIVILPLMFTVALAFTDYSQYTQPPRALLSWVGFDNFARLFFETGGAGNNIWQDTFISVFTWTIVWTLVATTLQISLGLFLALLVNDPRIKFKRLIRTILILPWAVPAFVTILVFAAMFNDRFGAINTDILALFNLSIPWLQDPFYTRIALIMIQTWLGFPFVFALFTGILQSISKDWYEAAEVDGASRFQKFRNITLPHVLFATAPLLIMQYAGNFNNFNIIYLFNEGGPAVRGQNAGGTDILISWVYDLTFELNQYSMAAAITIILGLIVTGFAIFQFRRTRAFKEEGNI